MAELKESVKNYVQSKVFEELGFDVSVSLSDETGDIVIKRLAKVCKTATGPNQITLSDAREIYPNAKIADTIEIPMESNMMVDSIVNRAVIESGKVEQAARRKQEILDSLKVEGIAEHCLIFANFDYMTAIGDCHFTLNGKYKVVISQDRKMPNDKFVKNQEYAMIVISIEDRKSEIILQASRITSSLVEELIRMSMVNSSADVRVRRVSRVPAQLTKVVVSCDDPNVNPTGLVVGNRGLRINTVEKYLNGEMIEVINYDPSTPSMVINLIGAEKFVDMHFFFEDVDYFRTLKTLNKRKMLVVVKDDQIGPVVGKAGVSLKLTDKISGWVIQIMSESDYNEKFPEGIRWSNDFDWMGVQLKNGYEETFYSYFLTSLGYHSVLDLANLEKIDYKRCKCFSDGDAEYLYNLVKGIEFSYKCPNCGGEIESHASSCPHCGAIFSE